jgi:aspartate 1-decarboxylase
MTTIEVLKSKIHRCTVTEANLNYVGSCTIDEDLLDAANMFEYEKIQIVNVNNGERLETYIIKGKRGSGVICMNGPAARKVMAGDMVVIMSYCAIDIALVKFHVPVVIFPKENNQL